MLCKFSLVVDKQPMSTLVPSIFITRFFSGTSTLSVVPFSTFSINCNGSTVFLQKTYSFSGIYNTSWPGISPTTIFFLFSYSNRLVDVWNSNPHKLEPQSSELPICQHQHVIYYLNDERQYKQQVLQR